MARKSKSKRTGADVFARKVGRNDPCPCGSNKKFKRCCNGPRDLGPASYQKVAEDAELHEAFLKRWGYHPTLVERSIMAGGNEEELVEYVTRKLEALHAHPKWIEAVQALKMLVTELNVQLISKEEAERWNEFVGDTPIELAKHCTEGCECHGQMTDMPQTN